MRANGTSRCLAAAGCVRDVAMETEAIFGRLEIGVGAAECATTQTVHFAASIGSEWSCAASAHADVTVSNKHRTPIALEEDRIRSRHKCVM